MKKVWNLWMPLCLAAAIWGCDSSQSSSSEGEEQSLTPLDQIKGHLNQGDFTAAEPLLKDLIKDNPQDADAWNMLGVVYFNTNRLMEADSFYSEALELDSTNFKYYFNRGQLRRQLNQTVFALSDLFKAQELAPNAAPVYIAKAETYLSVEDPGPAMRELRIALSLDSTNFITYFRMGQALQAMDSLDEAYTAYGKVLDLESQYGPAVYNSAMIHFMKDEVQNGCILLDRAEALGVAAAHEAAEVYCGGAHDHGSQQYEMMSQDVEGEE